MSGGFSGDARVWRYLADDGVSASFGLAADETLTRRQGRGESPPTLRLYTYRSHSALVGRFQRVSSEVRLDFCRANEIAVNRRPTGGGAIIMGEDQLGVAITLPEWASARSSDSTRELFTRFSEGIIQALRGFGIESEFKRKNDVEVNGKKVAGLGIYFDPDGGLLFHASLLVDLDIPLMLSVLNTPFEKISDKAIATVADRITTVRRECGRPVPLDEVRGLVRDAYSRTLGVELIAGDFTSDERVEIAALEHERYTAGSWIHQEPALADSAGSATLKTAGGLVSAHLTLAGDVIKAIYLTGDFFCEESVIMEIERALRWHSADPTRVARTLATLGERGISLPQIPSEELARVIAAAVDAAQRHEQGAIAKGCFVNP